MMFRSHSGDDSEDKLKSQGKIFFTARNRDSNF